MQISNLTCKKYPWVKDIQGYSNIQISALEIHVYDYETFR